VGSLAVTRCGLDEGRIADLRVAVSEACTNAIESYRRAATDSDSVIVAWRDEDDRLEVAIEDRGPGFDPGDLASHPPVTDPARLNYERGLGIPLIKELVDEVCIESSSSGTVVTIAMWRGTKKP
ncbi:MAG: ATP-binding protein, partial [Acidimicrobiales bacterium]